uniref:Velvet domain-containing protein n=1 Tax=Heligmosomoides polygyrus TaxID=6339 RepID=A0A183FVM0_HELPZ
LYFCGILKLSVAYETHKPQPERFDLDGVVALRTRPRVQFASCHAHSIDSEPRRGAMEEMRRGTTAAGGIEDSNESELEGNFGGRTMTL